jgi:hypothetical protein
VIGARIITRDERAGKKPKNKKKRSIAADLKTRIALDLPGDVNS